MRSVWVAAAAMHATGSKYMCGFDWKFASGVTSGVQIDSGCQPIRWSGHQSAS
jgi:hypothetical protein